MERLKSRREPVFDARTYELTPREIEVLAGIGDGKTYAQISAELHTSERTIRRHARDACRTLRVQRPIQAIVWAVRQDLL